MVFVEIYTAKKILARNQLVSKNIQLGSARFRKSTSSAQLSKFQLGSAQVANFQLGFNTSTYCGETQRLIIQYSCPYIIFSKFYQDAKTIASTK